MIYYSKHEFYGTYPLLLIYVTFHILTFTIELLLCNALSIISMCVPLYYNDFCFMFLLYLYVVPTYVIINLKVNKELKLNNIIAI